MKTIFTVSSNRSKITGRRRFEAGPAHAPMRSVPVPVMGIGNMRVLMAKRCVPMHMAVISRRHGVVVVIMVAIGLGFPLGVLLALGRRSTLPAVRMSCVVFIEAVRALPLLSILFVASIMLPLFLPESLLPDKFVRALVALTLFASAYFAEVVRGGLQAMPKGQFEAADSLGLPFWKTQRLVILPQAIRIVIPALANTVIVMIKNTSLVLVVGLFDITGTYDYSLDSAESEWDLDTQFSNCAVPEATLDGNLSWSQSVNAAGDTAQTITGTLSLTAPEGSASCTFDLTIETSSSGIRYSGSVCGYDAEAELGF